MGKRICTLVLFMGFSLLLSAQTLELAPQAVDVSPESCIGITEGDVWIFTTAGSCGGDIRIEHESGDEVFFSSSLESFEFEFDQPGIYIIFCGAQAPGDLSRVEATAACFSVIPIVPTIGQWGVIILTLLLAIYMVSSILEGKRSVLVR